MSELRAVGPPAEPGNLVAAVIDQPLILISQIQRSGGSMLAELFDGHPQVFAHPAELHIGYPQKWHWPRLDLAAPPLLWFARLFEDRLARFIQEGYAKAGSNIHARQDVRPYRFSTERQRDVFLGECARRRPTTQRGILDCYFTSYFAAWEDCRPTGRERYVSAFCPRLVMKPQSVAGYLADYPDGRLICSVRDPRTWYVSSHRHNPETYKDAATAIDAWRRSTEAILSAAGALPGRVMYFSYEALVRDPGATMRRVVQWLGIEFLDILTVPTYLGLPVKPNSSFASDRTGVTDTSDARLALLSAADRDHIEREAMDLYRRAVESSPINL